jgi:hypothetical protein
MSLPQMQFLNLPQIDAAIQQRKANEMQNALAPLLMQQKQMEVEKGGLEMQAFRDKAEREKLIRDDMAKLYLAQQGRSMQGQQPTAAAPTSYAAPDNPISPRVAAPDWMPQQVAQAPQPKMPEMDDRQKLANMKREQAKIYAMRGDMATANALEEQALKLEPEFGQTPQYDQKGNAFLVSKNGSVKMLDGFKARDKLVSDDLGGTRVLRTEYSADPVSTLAKTQTPDSVASNAIQIRGQNLTNARGIEANKIASQANTIIGGKQNFDAENKLGDDHKAQSKTFIDVRDAYTRLNSALPNATKSAAATLAGATVFMKLLDPGSVVRESELGMALAATGALDRATNYFNTLQRGKVLTASQAADFQKIGEQLYLAAEQSQKTLDSQYTEQSKRYGLNPQNVVKDYYAPPTKRSTVGGGKFLGFE